MTRGLSLPLHTSLPLKHRTTGLDAGTSTTMTKLVFSDSKSSRGVGAEGRGRSGGGRSRSGGGEGMSGGGTSDAGMTGRGMTGGTGGQGMGSGKWQGMGERAHGCSCVCKGSLARGKMCVI